MKENKIKSIKAREILDSRGNPTIEVKLITQHGVFLDSVPSGASKGKYEAKELRDKNGGVRKAVENANKIIAPVLKKENSLDQKRVDKILIQLDGTKNKSKLGANAILGVSMAVCRAGATTKGIPLYAHISEIFNYKLQTTNYKLPQPCFNIINGGKHAKGELDIQEFMIIPQAKTFQENFQRGKEVFATLKKILEKRIGKSSLKVGDEGGFAPTISKTQEALDLLIGAIKEAGCQKTVKIGLDCAASYFWKKGKYRLDQRLFRQEDLIDFYRFFIKKYPISLLEDPFAEEDLRGFKKITQKFGKKIIIVGDDLTTTNPQRIKLAKQQRLCNGIVIKPNQIGTITETLTAAKLAKSFGWKIVVSHRSGETKDDFIADLAVGIGADFIKAGAPGPKERMAKYNRLLEIEKEIKNF
jgi:enolase